MIVVLLAVMISLGLHAIHAQTSEPATAVSASRLVALVAGNSVPEDIAARLAQFGVDFQSDAAFRSLLQSAGADPKVLVALDSAKVSLPQGATTAKSVDIKKLEALASAGPLIKQKHYEDAARAVNAANDAGAPESDVAFVMGEVLRQRQDIPQAYAVYQKILADTPNFPEARVKLSYLAYRLGDPQVALRLAKQTIRSGAALAEAHKNSGLALESLRKSEAAKNEYEAALEIKPDYEAALMDLGNVYNDNGQQREAIDYYNRVAAVDPDDPDIHMNLGSAYKAMGDFESAVREYRTSLRLNPHQKETRNSLGQALVHHGDYAAAVQTFAELVDMYPDYAECHDCYGTALFNTWDFDGAEKQFRAALALEPNDAPAHLGLGEIREEQKRYPEAFDEYKQANQLDNTLADPYSGMGRVLMVQGKYDEAIATLKEGAEQRPDSARIHGLLAQAMSHSNAGVTGALSGAPKGSPSASGAGSASSGAASGGITAVGEAQQSAALDPENIQAMLTLAKTYETSGEWVNALLEYRKASLAAGSSDLRGKVIRIDESPARVQQAYEDAQTRWKQHLSALRLSGKSDEANALEAKLKASTSAPGLADQVDQAMQAGAADDKQRDFAKAVVDFQHAVDLAEKMQPHDARLVTALDKLGNNQMGQDNVAAKTAYEREYKEACALFGANSGSAAQALQSLARFETFTKDYASAEHHYFQAVDIATKNFGEGSDEAAKAELAAAGVYIAQKDFAKAEPYVLRAEKSEEALIGNDNPDLMMSLSAECYMYDQWGKSQQTDACDQHLIAILQKRYGNDSPFMVPILMSDAKALRSLGKAADADAMEQRVASIRSSSMQPPH